MTWIFEPVYAEELRAAAREEPRCATCYESLSTQWPIVWVPAVAFQPVDNVRILVCSLAGVGVRLNGWHAISLIKYLARMQNAEGVFDVFTVLIVWRRGQVQSVIRGMTGAST
jgi:hypothetical protein